MSHRFNPQRLDVLALARTGDRIERQDPVTAFERLARTIRAVPAAEPVKVVWSAHGRWHVAGDGVERPAVALQIDTRVPLTCQRCLDVVWTPVQLERVLVFSPDEAAIAELDAQLPEDVLPLQPLLDFRPIVEDEILLALPMVPRHARCPHEVITSVGAGSADGAERGSDHPFAALRAWRSSDSR